MAGTKTQVHGLEGSFYWTPDGGTEFEYAISGGDIGFECETVDGTTSKSNRWRDEKDGMYKLSSLSIKFPYDTDEAPLEQGKLNIGSLGVARVGINDTDYLEGPARVKDFTGPFWSDTELQVFTVNFSPAGGPWLKNGLVFTSEVGA